MSITDTDDLTRGDAIALVRRVAADLAGYVTQTASGETCQELAADLNQALSALDPDHKIRQRFYDAYAVMLEERGVDVDRLGSDEMSTAVICWPGPGRVEDLDQQQWDRIGGPYLDRLAALFIERGFGFVWATWRRQDGGATIERIDVRPFLEQASPDAIAKLEANGWTSEYPCDDVAEVARTTSVALDTQMAYAEHDGLGYETSVDAEQARIWLRARRPDVSEPAAEPAAA